jgi:hypothetical protein
VATFGHRSGPHPRHATRAIGPELALHRVHTRPLEPLLAFPTTSCPGFGVPRGWQVVWSDLQRGGDLHSEARAPDGSGVSIACDRGAAARVGRRPTAPPGMRALRVAGRGGVSLELLAPARGFHAALAVFHRVVAAQRSAAVLRRVASRTLRWRPARGAIYYNVQVFDGRRRIVLAWPRRPSLRVQSRLLRAGRRYAWYAWPAYGSYAHPRFGPPLATARLVGTP